MALCRVTGTLYLPSGEPAASYNVYLTKVQQGVVPDYLGSVVPEMVRVPVSAVGTVDFEILTGSYHGIAGPRGGGKGFSFNFLVPDAPSDAFEDCIDTVPPEPPVPSWYEQALAAAAAAEQSAIDAQVAAESLDVQVFETYAEALAYSTANPNAIVFSEGAEP